MNKRKALTLSMIITGLGLPLFMFQNFTAPGTDGLPAIDTSKLMPAGQTQAVYNDPRPQIVNNYVYERVADASFSVRTLKPINRISGSLNQFLFVDKTGKPIYTNSGVSLYDEVLFESERKIMAFLVTIDQKLYVAECPNAYSVEDTCSSPKNVALVAKDINVKTFAPIGSWYRSVPGTLSQRGVMSPRNDFRYYWYYTDNSNRLWRIRKLEDYKHNSAWGIGSPELVQTIPAQIVNPRVSYVATSGNGADNHLICGVDAAKNLYCMGLADFSFTYGNREGKNYFLSLQVKSIQRTPKLMVSNTCGALSLLGDGFINYIVQCDGTSFGAEGSESRTGKASDTRDYHVHFDKRIEKRRSLTFGTTLPAGFVDSTPVTAPTAAPKPVAPTPVAPKPAAPAPAALKPAAPVTPKSCSFNGTTIPSGTSVTGYLASSVPSGSSCATQMRLCKDGVLSGSYAFGSCLVLPPPTPAKNIKQPLNFMKGKTRFDL